MSACPTELRAAIDMLWNAGKLTPHNLYTAPAFVALQRTCRDLYPGAGSRQSLNFTLSQALYNLGFRWTADNPAQHAVPTSVAADRIDAAFHQTRCHRIHLCPLDQADEIPPRQFGPNSIRTFTAEELNDFVDPHGVTRKWADWRFDSRRFCEFTWLVVEEFVDLPGEPGARALPAFFIALDRDFGRIEPHKPLYPPAVEAALFALLTAPWEEVTVHSNIDWRPFRIPWVYTFDDDLFARIPVPPSPDSLSWETDFHHGADGVTIEYERPQRLLLEDDADVRTKYLNDSAWQELMVASASPLFAGPVRHFIVRAFASDGIDEFLAHILVVEAALGLVDDHSRQPKLPGNPGATARVGARLGGLLNDPTARERYKELFAERSRFLHGQAMLDIPSTSVLEARRLARQCVCALIGAANSDAKLVNREAFLQDLLRRSWS